MTRNNPLTGEVLAKVDVPATQVTSCAFGGPGLDQLFITTARHGLSDEQLEEHPAAGGLFRVSSADLADLGVCKGVVAPDYNDAEAA